VSPPSPPPPSFPPLAGLALELASPLFPAAFLLLACLGSLARAVTGVAGGATRMALTQHFARRGNAADIAAKEGSQVAAAGQGWCWGWAVWHAAARLCSRLELAAAQLCSPLQLLPSRTGHPSHACVWPILPPHRPPSVTPVFVNIPASPSPHCHIPPTHPQPTLRFRKRRRLR
jgi:hypothetical protein